MKIALIGAAGMLGSDLLLELKKAGHLVYDFDIQDGDITNPKAIAKALQPLLPLDYIINSAAYTQVDKAEKEKEKSFLINAIGVQNLADFCKKNKTCLISFSTDYIFDGNKNTPYLEIDIPQPINYYGYTKLEGEKAITNTLTDYYIFRLQWLYGLHGNNFIKKIIELSHSKSEIKIVNDQWGSPSYTANLAKVIVEILTKKVPYGIYNLANKGYTNWYEFAQYFCKFCDIKTKLLPVSTTEFITPAKRPKNSRLSLDKLEACDIKSILSWQDALQIFLESSIIK